MFQKWFFLAAFSFTMIRESQDCRGGGGHFFNSSLPLPPSSQTLEISQAYATESSPLHISSRFMNFPNANNCKTELN